MKILKSKLSLEKRRSQFLSVGLIVALSFTLVAFEWGTSYEDLFKNERYEMEELEVEEVIYVKPQKKKKAKKTITKKAKTKKVITKFKVGDKPDDSKKKDEEPELDFKKFPKVGDDDDEKLDPEIILTEFIRVERMPHFIECDDILDEQELDNCTYKSLYKHVRSNLKIDERITMAGSQKAHVSFLVNQQGEITSIEFLNTISKELQKEITRVLEATPALIPGMQRGKPVNVRYNIPIKITVG